MWFDKSANKKNRIRAKNPTNKNRRTTQIFALVAIFWIAMQFDTQNLPSLSLICGSSRLSLRLIYESFLSIALSRGEGRTQQWIFPITNDCSGEVHNIWPPQVWSWNKNQFTAKRLRLSTWSCPNAFLQQLAECLNTEHESFSTKLAKIYYHSVPNFDSRKQMSQTWIHWSELFCDWTVESDVMVAPN